jgi:hypothetical protein
MRWLQVSRQPGILGDEKGVKKFSHRYSLIRASLPSCSTQLLEDYGTLLSPVINDEHPSRRDSTFFFFELKFSPKARPSLAESAVRFNRSEAPCQPGLQQNDMDIKKRYTFIDEPADPLNASRCKTECWLEAYWLP